MSALVVDNVEHLIVYNCLVIEDIDRSCMS